jgi:hypothetical protein
VPLKIIKNRKDGFHLNSHYWQNYKKSIPLLPQDLFDICVGMILGDASVYKVSSEAYLKFEQGYKQKQFIDHLFHTFKNYCFMENPKARLQIRGDKEGELKSFWFKTFSHKSFTNFWDLFYERSKKKTIPERLILDHLNGKGLAYWVMCDGSLQKYNKTIILHSQGFNHQENQLLSCELNTKFNLHTKVIAHKNKYSVIQTHVNDCSTLYKILNPYIIPSMRYKLPKLV